MKSGLLVEIITKSENPDAKSPTASDSCDVTYSGTLKDGTKFDSGRTSFAPNQVIKGKLCLLFICSNTLSMFFRMD